MKTIPSFMIDHLKLMPGIYVSRKDNIGSVILTTFDIRLTAPYRDPVLDTDGIHAIEHLGATFLRNDSKWQDKVIYFGPMGCRTGFYLIIADNLESHEIVSLLIDLFTFIIEFHGDIPGADAKSCGNYKDMSLKKAKQYSKKFYDDVLTNINQEILNY